MKGIFSIKKKIVLIPLVAVAGFVGCGGDQPATAQKILEACRTNNEKAFAALLTGEAKRKFKSGVVSMEDVCQAIRASESTSVPANSNSNPREAGHIVKLERKTTDDPHYTTYQVQDSSADVLVSIVESCDRAHHTMSDSSSSCRISDVF